MRSELEFFKNNPGYKRVFQGIFNRYRSLGRLGGTVTLTNLSPQEKLVLSNHLRLDLSNKSRVSFSVLKFADSLMITKFADYSLEEILAYYFETELVSNREKLKLERQEREAFFQELAEGNKNTLAGEWLDKIEKKEAAGIVRIFQVLASEREYLKTVVRALNLLEQREIKFWRLPVFASLVTTDPHAFDLETTLGKLLIDALATVLGVATPSNREETSEILYASGLLVDELSNSVSVLGLRGFVNNEPHPVWQGAFDLGEPLVVPLLNLSKLDYLESPNGVVFVVENPAVFTAILDALGDNPPPPLVCTAGQVKLAGLILLNLLEKSGTTIYYSGDLDPEGLLIAEGLKKRFPKSLHYLHFTVKEYQMALSTKKLSSLQLAKLKSITDPELLPLVKVMEETKLAAYEELLLEILLERIKSVCY